MNEEEAVFILGKQLSELRNSGEDLSDERILVGKSWVLPSELADEYDKHFPPGPRRHKQVTDAVYHYSLVPVPDCRGELTGLHITTKGRSIDVLEKAYILHCHFRGDLSERIRTSKCNRYDVIEGISQTFVIDKVEEKISASRICYAADNVTCSQETPISGNQRVHIEGSGGWIICSVYFPFFKFADFWKALDGYIEFRKRQIAELRNEGPGC